MDENWAFNEISNPDCRLCGLYKKAQSVCLVGQGPRDAKVMVIGEAPGQREDDIRRPFSGPAGQRLDLELQRVGIKREDIYITNVIKCRPPENRTPEKSEMKACYGYLEKELEIIRPSYILLLGNIALQAVLKKSGITKYRGEIYRVDNKAILATFHPSAIRRFPHYEPYFFTDFIRFSQIVKGVKQLPPPRVTIVRSLEQLRELIQAIKESPVFAYDVETEGLYEWVPFSRLWCLGIATSADRAWVIPLEHPEHKWSDFAKDQIHKTLIYIFETLERKRAAHNGEYDNRWLRSRDIQAKHTFDSMIAAHLLNENLAKGLESLAGMFLGVSPYKTKVDVTLHPPPLEPLCDRCGEDVCHTFALREILGEQLVEDKRLLKLFKRLLMPATQVISKVEATGIYVDPERLKERTKVAEEKKGELIEELNKITTREDVNWSSPKHLQTVFYKDFKLPILEYTPTGQPSTAEPVIKRLKNEHPVVSTLLKYREVDKRLNTFLIPWAEWAQWDGRLHANYNLTGTRTGRPSSHDPNLQQTERGEFIRGIISVPEGSSLISADFEQVEMRLAAIESGDPALIEIFLTDQDVHAATARRITGKKEVTKVERKKAKAINFGLLYGMGWRGLQRYALDKYDVVLSDEEAQEARRIFFEMYPRLVEWHRRRKEEVRKYHQVRSMIGRIRHLPDILSTDKDVRAEAERQAINSPVQGLGAELCLLGAVLLEPGMDWETIKIVGLIHDCLLFECEDGIIDTWVTKIKWTMENLPLGDYFGFFPSVPIKVSVKVSKYWEGEA